MKAFAIVEVRGDKLEQVKSLKNIYEEWKQTGSSLEHLSTLTTAALTSGYTNSLASGLLTQILMDCDSLEGLRCLKIKMEVSGE